MDIKLETVNGQSSLEYNVIGGILDLYFFAGPEPVAVAKQYAEVAGLPTMMPYWGLGFHQCRYGYRDWIDVAEVIYCRVLDCDHNSHGKIGYCKPLNCRDSLGGYVD